MSLDANLSKSVIDEIARQLGIEADELYKAGLTFLPLIFPVHLTNLQRIINPYGGEIEDNATEITLVNNTAKDESLTVPAGKRWFVLGGRTHNGDDVARNCYVSVRNAALETLTYFVRSQSIAAGDGVYFPNSEATVLQIGGGGYPFQAKAGWQIRFYFAAGGASTGGTAKVRLFVVEVDE